MGEWTSMAVSTSSLVPVVCTEKHGNCLHFAQANPKHVHVEWLHDILKVRLLNGIQSSQSLELHHSSLQYRSFLSTLNRNYNRKRRNGWILAQSWHQFFRLVVWKNGNEMHEDTQGIRHNWHNFQTQTQIKTAVLKRSCWLSSPVNFAQVCWIESIQSIIACHAAMLRQGYFR